MSKKKKKKKAVPAVTTAPIMRKAKVHSNEDLKAYDRQQTRKEEREAQEGA